MPKKSKQLYPASIRILRQLGLNLKSARLRRRFSMATVSIRADISRPTLYRIESGDPAVTIGNYMQVLRVLGLDCDILSVAKDDALGRKLQDEDLPLRKRAPKVVKPSGLSI